MNKTACIFCSVLLCLALRPCLAQTNKADSLRALLSRTTDPPNRLRLEYALGKTLHHADSLDFYGKRLLAEARKLREPLATGYGERLLGDADFYRLQYENAYGHYFRADSAFQVAGEGRERLTVLSNGAYALMLLGRYGDAIAWASTQMELADSQGNTDNAGQAARSIGDCLLKQKKYREALPYFYKSLSWEKQNDPQDLICVQLAVAYEHLQMPDSAQHYYEKSLQLAQQRGIPFRIATAHQYYGMFFLNQNALDEAEKHLLAAESLLKNKQDKLSGPGLYKSLSDLELRRNRPEAVIRWAQKALDAMQNNRQAMYWGPVHANLYQAYAALGQPDKALQHALVWKAAADSLAAADNARKIAEVEARFKTREQDAVIARQDLELARQRGYLLFGLLAIALTGGLAYFFWLRNRAKKREAEYHATLHETETRRLRELDRVKSAFFANISHEFRTPLSLLISPLRELETGARTGNTKMYAIMRRNAERLLQLVNQLLDLSRLENGRLQLEPRPGNLSAALRAIAGSFESLADRRSIHFDVFVPKAPVWASFDRDKLEKIVSNLLSNAFKFTPEEGTVTLRLNAEPGTDETTLLAVVQVEDTGMGIPSDQLPRIFERFYQADTQVPDAPGGSGIGLALTKELVQLHGGRIDVESVERKGSRFRVFLPLRRAEATPEWAAGQEPETTSQEEPEKTPPPLAGVAEASVLVVEDNADLQEYIAGLLDSQYRVFRANDGQAGLRLALLETPDLVLTDLMMPDTDGLALTAQLKNDPRTSHIPVVMLTAKADREDRIQGLETGAEAYLTKPFDAGELRALVERLIDQRRILQEKYSRMVLPDSPPASKLPSLEEQFLQDVLHAIDEQMDDDLFGVEQLAAAVNMSRSNLFRKLDALTGKSPTQLIRERRLARAKQLLEQGRGNTSEVALMVGFNTPAYFIKCFVDQYGVTPGELRKRV